MHALLCDARLAPGASFRIATQVSVIDVTVIDVTVIDVTVADVTVANVTVASQRRRRRSRHSAAICWHCKTRSRATATN